MQKHELFVSISKATKIFFFSTQNNQGANQLLFCFSRVNWYTRYRLWAAHHNDGRLTSDAAGAAMTRERVYYAHLLR